jgi:hypothetical protein
MVLRKRYLDSLIEEVLGGINKKIARKRSGDIAFCR